MLLVEVQIASLVNNTRGGFGAERQEYNNRLFTIFSYCKRVLPWIAFCIYFFHLFAHALWDKFLKLRLLDQKINEEHCQILLQGDLPFLHFQQQCLIVPVFPQLHQRIVKIRGFRRCDCWEIDSELNISHIMKNHEYFLCI